jgi:hypothetical protein
MAHQAFRPGRLATGLLFAILLMAPCWRSGLVAADKRMLPPSLPKEQQENLLQFLKEHEKPARYVPKGARIVDTPPPAGDTEVAATKDKPIKQYTVRITPHRPVPGEEKVTRADVYYYRPNPVKGKQGIAIKYTVDLTTGKQVGPTEVMTKAHTPVSREELAEAVALVKEKSEAVKKLYEGRPAQGVRWEYLQMKIDRKTAQFAPGDRVVRFVFTANPFENEKPPTPVRVVVNLTSDRVFADER